MPEKTITVAGVTYTMRPIRLRKYYELMDAYEKTGNKAALSRGLIFWSLQSWDVRGPDGTTLPLTMDTFSDQIGLDSFGELERASIEVNRLDEAQKKT